MKIRKYLSIVFFILCLSMLFFIPSVKAFDDIDYEFQREVLFDESDPELNLFNMRDQQVYNGTYPAIFSFTNEIDGTSGDSIDFIDIHQNPLTSVIDIIPLLDSHKKVLHLSTNSLTGDNAFGWNNDLGNQESGIIELWISTNNTIGDTQFALFDGYLGTQGFIVGIFNDSIAYHNGSWNNIINAINNTFYHLKLEFECSSGGFQQLSDNTFFLWINGVKYGSFSFTNNITNVDSVRVGLTNNLDYSGYFDAIDYSFGFDDIFYETYTFQEFADDDEFNTSISPYESWTYDDDGVGNPQVRATIQDDTDNGIDGNYLALVDDRVDKRILVKETLNISSTFTVIGYWFRPKTDTTCYFVYRSDNISIVVANLSYTDDMRLWDDTDGHKYLADMPLDTWSYILVRFDSDAHLYYVYINNTIVQTNDYKLSTVYIKSFEMFTIDTDAGSIHNIDSLSVGNYSIDIHGRNLKPILETLEGFEGLLETDKYEFSFLNVNTRATIGATSFGLWQFTTSGTGLAQISSDGSSLDRTIRLQTGVGVGTANITRTGLSITNNLIDVNVGFKSDFGGATHGILEVLLKASDESIITGFKVDVNTNNLSYWNGSWNVLRNDIDVITNYDINLFLNYDIDIVRLEFIVEGNFISNYVFDMVSIGKNGLFEIDIRSSIENGQDDNQFLVDYVGVYRNGESWHGELGIITTPIGVDYHFERHYLYSSIGTGRYHQAIVEGSYIGGETPFQSMKNITTISGISKDGLVDFTNTYEFFWHNFSNTNLVLTCVGSDISFTSITIEGSKLVEGSKEYFLIYSSGGLDSRESYFYVSSSTLRFIHNTSIDNINEFIQAEFNIDDKTSVDTAISYTTDIGFNAFGYFRINFTDDTSQVIVMENTLKTKRFLLPTNKTIGSFVILISDNNNNFIEGITTGLVRDISLLDIETAIISIVSLNLVDMIIPLIIILLPTLAISGIYGDFLVIPLFILFSLILTITSIIPFWLFFVIILSSSVFIFFEKDNIGV